MASFTLNWTPIITPNVTAQRAYYRRKSVGGSFLTDGFTPANDLGTAAVTAARAALLDNVIYEFQIANICTEGGPTFNDNGIQEFIDFVCSVPMTYDITETTVTVNFVGLPGDINQVQIAFQGQPLQTVVVTGGNASHQYTGLTADTSYTVTAKYGAIVNGVQIFDSINTCSDTVETAAIACAPATNLAVDGQEPNLIWIADNTVCESSSQFEIDREITGLQSPSDTFYDAITGRTYVADLFAADGNIYWFDANTATGAGDMTYSAAVNIECYGVRWDAQYRRCYLVGRNTGGMIVYDIATDSASTISYGVDGGAFNRLGITIGATNIYSNYKGAPGNSVVIVNRATLALTNVLISTIPNNARFSLGGYSLSEADGKIFVAAGSGSGVSTVGVYSFGFAANLTNVVLPTTALWEGKYWQSIFTDPVGGNVYVGDFGSSTRYVINPSSYAILDTKTIQAREGRNVAVTSWTINTVNNDLFLSIGCANASSDAQITRTLRENRSTYNFEYMYDGLFLYNLNAVGATGILTGADVGLPPWVNPSITDGKISILNMYAPGDNTGRKITKTLQEVDANNGNVPTGNTKPNLPDDPDYIGPVDDLIACPITYTTNCPADQTTDFRASTLYYEFSLPNSVINNPAIDIIQVEAFNNDTTVVDGVPNVFNSPFSNFFSGGIGALGGTNYSLRIRYITAPSTVIQTC